MKPIKNEYIELMKTKSKMNETEKEYKIELMKWKEQRNEWMKNILNK